jgi:hypothetical protein
MRVVNLGTLVLSVLLCPFASYGTSYYLVTTSQATANTQLDINHTRSWSFSPTEDFDLGGGSFKIKKGPSTTIDAVLTLFAGTGLDLIDDPVHVGATIVSKSSYEYAAFLFDTPITLTAGSNYVLMLTSLTGDVGSEQYFIKGGSNAGDFGFYETYPEGDDPAPAPTNDGPASPVFDPLGGESGGDVPEPGTYLLVGSTLLIVTQIRKRR